MEERIHLISQSGKWDIYVYNFFTFLKPHRSSTQLQCYQLLREEASDLLSAIDKKIQGILADTETTVELWVTEVGIVKDEFIIKHRLLKCVKCKVKWKVYGDWGYAKDKWYYLNTIPVNWEKEVEGGIVSYRKMSPEKPSDDEVKKQISKLLRI